MLVESWLLRAARRRPDHAALVGPGYALTYAELRDEVDGVARRLAVSGVSAGDRVGLVLPPGRAFVVTLHAILRLGAIAVPLDPQLPEGERERRLAGAVLTVDAVRHAVHPPGPGKSRDQPPRTTAGRSAGGDAFPVGRDDGHGNRRRDIDGTSDDAPLLDAHDLDAVAIVVHTSGTSGASKPIPLTYGNWLWSAIGSAATLACPPDERWLCAMPLNHVGGLSVLLRSAIAGTTAVVHERWDTEAVLAALTGEAGARVGPRTRMAGTHRGDELRVSNEEAATMVSLVPTTLRRLLDAGLRGGPDGARMLRWVLLGGAAIPAGLLEDAAAAGIPVAPTYGMSETTSQIATLGPPLFCTRVRIAGMETVPTAPEGTVGEILVSGPTVSTAVTDDDGWLHTGDLGRLDARGHLTVVGRTSDTIITGGENVLPLEVERILDAFPGVAESAVFGRPDPEWGERVCALIVAEPGADLDREALRTFIGERLAAHQRPREIELLDELPRTPSGKILRRALR